MKIHLTIHLKSAHFIMVNYATVQKNVWGTKKCVYMQRFLPHGAYLLLGEDKKKYNPYVNCIICWKFSAVGRRQQNKGIGNHCEIDAILNIIIREDFMEEVTFA